MYICDICGEEFEEIYIDLKTGEYMCADCYHAQDDDSDDDCFDFAPAF